MKADWNLKIYIYVKCIKDNLMWCNFLWVISDLCCKEVIKISERQDKEILHYLLGSFPLKTS